ncbi:MAG TPA: SDR family oxidoreductase [Terriglobales bacterium]|jgi:NAD(P)-dependent dehydrogenase (short-subunit alcohol dehydrogenase family)|nr:SDR family oxidoreductase [Terriglobales bacterium]
MEKLRDLFFCLRDLRVRLSGFAATISRMPQNKVAVVTGSSSGFGLLTVVELAKAGFFVVATMRQPDRRTRLDEALARSGKDLSSRVEVRQLDVTDFERIPAAMADIVRAHGRIDVLVNNAGFGVGGFAEDVLLDELRMQLETNFFGQVAVTKAVLPTMRAQRSGHIIMVSSILGLIGQPMVSSYCASKHALEGWAEALRIEVRSLGIKIVLVEPGAYKTDIWTRNVMVSRGSTDESSPNKERSRRYVAGVKESQREMADPEEVAHLISSIAQDPNPRLRYRAGRDAKIGYFMRALLPWSIWEGMVEKRTKIG